MPSVQESFLNGSDKTAILTYENAELIELIQQFIIFAKQNNLILNKQAGELESLLHFPDKLEDVPSEVIVRGGRRWR